MQWTRVDNLTICYCKKQIDVSFSCVCPVIDNEFNHNITKVGCASAQQSTGTLTMPWWNSWSITGQMREKLTSVFCSKNISDKLGMASCATFLLLPHLDVICNYWTDGWPCEICLIGNSNWTKWSTFQGVIAQAISKWDECEANLKLQARFLPGLYYTRSNC